MLADLHLFLAEVHWKAGRPIASLDVVRRRQALWPGDGPRLYHSGRELARLLAGPDLPADVEQRLWTELESALTAAAGAGFRDWARVQSESEWQTIRADQRLRDLLARLR